MKPVDDVEGVGEERGGGGSGGGDGASSDAAGACSRRGGDGGIGGSGGNRANTDVCATVGEGDEIRVGANTSGSSGAGELGRKLLCMEMTRPPAALTMSAMAVREAMR